MRKIQSYIRRAVDDYGMIEEGDHIAVGVSGGKDSLALLMALAKLRIYYPKKFHLEAITLDMGFKGTDFSEIVKLCEEIDVNYSIVKTDIAEIVFDIRKEKNPCSLCAKMRRGALHEAAIEHGCKKVALGHHNDDVLETLFLSLFFEGQLHTFSPVTYLDRRDVTLIRPFIYLPEKEVKRFVKANDVPVVHNPCPANGNTKRQYFKDMITQFEHDNRGVKERFFTAIKNSKIHGWATPEE